MATHYAEVLDSDGNVVGQGLPDELAEDFLYGTMPRQERAWRQTVARIDQGYKTMLQELGVRAPKKPGYARTRKELLASWRKLKYYIANTTSIARGSVSPAVMAQLKPFEVAYGRIRLGVSKARGRQSGAPRQSQLKVEPKARAAPGFFADLRDSTLLVGVIVVVGVLVFNSNRRS